MRVARNSQWGAVLGVWGRGLQSPEAKRGPGAKPLAVEGWGSGGGAPSPRKFCIFLQKQLNFRAILIKINAFKTWHRNWQRNMIQLVALMGYMGSG